MDVRKGIKKLDISVKAGLLTGSAFWRTAECTDIGMEAVAVSDGPHGLRVQDKMPNHLGMGTSHPSTCFPTSAATACSWDTALGEELGECLGREAAAMGVSMVLGPGLNLKRSPLCGRNFEYFSEDPYLSGKFAAAYVRGIQKNGTAACIKHFAVNSRERGRMVYDCIVDEQTLRESYLSSFEIAVKEGKPAAVMTAYNKINGTYCNGNERLVGGILRGEWGFDGLVISDWGGTFDKVASVRSGVDLEMPRCDFSSKEVEDAVRRGELDERIVDASIERQQAFSAAAQKVRRESVDWQAHSDFAARCAENSMVLLKNEGSALPLSDSEKVAVIGDFAANARYQGAGSSLVNATKVTGVLDAIKVSRINFIGYERGFKRDGGESRKLASRAVRLAERADTVILCLGLGEGSELESCDRTDIDLPENQIKLLSQLKASGKKIVVLLFCGGVVDTSWDGDCSALLHCFLSGQSCGTAAVRVLTGEVNPSGRLTESFPLALADVPCAEIYNKYPYKMDYAEGIYVGYKYYGTLGKRVKYPFGYGLSYTTFACEDFSVREDGVQLTVKNTGERDGATVVQMYITAPRPELEKSPRELKGFEKVFLRAGESRRVFIPFDEYSFRVWDISRGLWREGGTYKAEVGFDSVNMLCSGEVAKPLREYCAGGKSDVATESAAAQSGAQAVAAAAPQSYKEYFESRISPVQPKVKHKKGDLVATVMTEIYDLKYCKGFVARLFSFIASLYARSKDEILSNSMTHLPIRFILLFMHYNEVQVEGFLEACNGSFLKGMKKIILKK